MSHACTMDSGKEGINVTVAAFLSYIFIYPFHTHDVTAAMLMLKTNPVGVELFSYVNAFCCNKFA